MGFIVDLFTSPKECRWRQWSFFVYSALFLAAFPHIDLRAAHATPPDRPAVTIYQGQGVDTNLRELLLDIATGDLKFDETYFTGIGYFHPLPTPYVMQRVFDFLCVPNTGTGLEAIVVKHYGLQNNWEADLDYTMRFAELRLCMLTLRFGFGFGLSYAFGTPSY
jgi:hypothetical protein